MEWEAIQNTIVRVAMWAMLILVLLALAYYGVGELLEDYFAPDPWEIFAPPGSYVEINGEYVPVPSDWKAGDPIP